MNEVTKSVVEIPVVAPAVVWQALPAMTDTVPAIVPSSQESPIVLSQVGPAVSTEAKPGVGKAEAPVAAPAGEKK